MSKLTDNKGNIKPEEKIGTQNTDEEFSLYVSRELKVSVVDADRIVEAYSKAIKRKLIADGTLHLRHIGVFYTKVRKACTVKNVSTGQKCVVPPTKMIRFRSSASLKHGINGVVQKQKPLM